MRLRPPRIGFSESWLLAFAGHATTHRHRALAICACLVAGIVFASVADTWRRGHAAYEQQREALRDRLALLERHQPAPAPTEPVRTPAEAARHNGAVRQLNIPWSDIFDGLERHVDADVALTSLEPDAATGMLRLQAEARRIDTLFSYAQQLSSDAAFSALLPRQHETNELDPNRPARLSFEVRLKDSSAAGMASP